ncbi:hypothetical protein GEMRC1_003703 [Eukaryota sp. GEM-RC1]
MQVLESITGIVTPFEIVRHIQRHRDVRNRSMKSTLSEPLSVVHVEEQLADYLAYYFYLEEDNIKSVIQQLQQMTLSRFEIANILCELPTSVPHAMRIIEECEERYTTADVEQILSVLEHDVFRPLFAKLQANEGSS